MSRPKYRTSHLDHFCAQCKQVIQHGILHAYDKDRAVRYHIACAPERPRYESRQQPCERCGEPAATGSALCRACADDGLLL